ncbi:hypothetical protein [Aliarcobacter vitoriensis]|uniref:Uncharacterized protein n=1 Tax=Aliarcobacter vitoriensis TaxID=2011099 RepID=A0A366MQ23_9BACT|nr:hypothetical protein [Aliarcobacter vitoriensis]RBQ28388.1 hypothetical protein CRU91_09210 [Aliarcobacter vitoriensis]
MSANTPIVRKFPTEDDKYRFLIGKGGVGIQLSEDEAMSVARRLALLLGLCVLEKGVNMPFAILNANQNSTREKPLGGDDTEEHS